MIRPNLTPPTRTDLTGSNPEHSNPRANVTFIADSRELDRCRVGGKSHHLARLLESGADVPTFFTVTTEACAEAIRLAGLDEASVEILHRALPSIELPEGLKEAITRACRFTFDDGALLAVRSSAIGEDGDEASFAGLHESFVFVRGQKAVHDAIRHVWASACSPRALAYRRQHGMSAPDPRRGLGLAVVVQRMVDAQRSAVLFTADPHSGDVHRMALSALYGAGEGLVSRGLAADLYFIDKESGEIEKRIETKEEELVHDLQAGGLRSRAVEGRLRDASCLSEEEIRQAYAVGERIERFFGRPQDIELCFDRGGRLFVLQSRPVTTVKEWGPAAGAPALWDNSNIIESYAGVTSPMTFSFIQHAYAHVYRCFCDVMGIGPEKVRAHRGLFTNMLGLFRGRVYYNLENWYRLIRLFPGYGANRGFMESMMGVRQSLGAESGRDPAKASGLWGRLKELPALLRLVLTSAFRFLRIRSRVGRFEAHFQRCFGRWSKLDMERMKPHELQALFREMEEKLLWRWHAPIINDFFVMIFYGALKGLCRRWCGDEDGTLQNDLVCGEGGILSTEPTRKLLEIARDAHRDPELRSLLLEKSPETMLQRLEREPRFAEFHARIVVYLDLYGFRSIDELKLEEPSLEERPAFLFKMLANYVRRDEPIDPQASFERERKVRLEAERRVDSSLGPIRRLIFRRVLAAARLGVKNRENLRFARTKIYGLVRRLLNALGESLASGGLLDERSDIFYLTLDEVWSFLEGTAVTTNLRALVALRRRQFDTWRAMEAPDDRFSTYGLPYHRNRLKARPSLEEPDINAGLVGVGCCPGQVSGPVKVADSPHDVSLDGEILVAERTDPGWVPLYPTISGLLIERGSILSHSAIVAREMGLPTIVGISGLTSRLEDGAFVSMDGRAGTVYLEAGPFDADPIDADLSAADLPATDFSGTEPLDPDAFDSDRIVDRSAERPGGAS